MFSTSELLTELPRITLIPATSLSIIKYAPEDFSTPSSEECIEIHRGSTVGFESVLHFWIKSLESLGWSGREQYFLPYAKSGKCSALSQVAFNHIVAQHCSQLKQPCALPLHSEAGFRGTLQMYDDWNDVALVASYDDEYVTFYWNTSA